MRLTGPLESAPRKVKRSVLARTYIGAKVGAVPTSRKIFSIFSAGFLPLLLVACAADTVEEQDVDGAEASDLTSSLRLGSGTTSFTLRQTSSRDMTVTVDCHPPADPDDPGPVFKLSAPALGTSGSEPAAGPR